MKKVLRAIAIVLWGFQLILGIILFFSREYYAAGFIAAPAILSLYILLAEKIDSKNFRKAQPAEVSQTPQNAPKVKPQHRAPAPKSVLNPSPCKDAQSSFFAVAPLSKILSSTNYIVLDVETTGLSPINDSLLEVAALKVIDGHIVERYESLIDPHKPIPPMITRITGISDQMVRGKPDISAVMAELDFFMDADLPIVAHNATFDLKFITTNLDRVQRGHQLQYIDTLDLSRDAFPGLDNHKLETLISALHLADGAQKHRAMADAEATQKLFVKCQKNLILRGEASVLNDSTPDPIDDADVDEEDNDPGFLLNQIGMKHEAKGEIDCAISYYEESVKAGFEGTHPYKRLAVLYRKQHRYLDELRICDAALKMLEGRPNAERKIMDFEHRRTAALGKQNKESPV